MKKYLSYFFWIGIYLSIGFGIGMSTESAVEGWYATLEKPSFNPPNWIFPIMWSFLYVLIASAGWNIWRQERTPNTLKAIFIIYTLLNWTWTPIFFGAEQILLGFAWIVIINVITLLFIIRAWDVVRISSYLMIPPLLWTLFAAVLNYSILMLNT